MVKHKLFQAGVALVALALAVYLSFYLLKQSSPLVCSTGVPCPQDCNKCPLA